MISDEMLNKIKSFDNDDSDLVIKMIQYLNHEYKYIDSNNIIEDINEIGELNDENVYFMFDDNYNNLDKIDVITAEDFNRNSEFNNENNYYLGKNYDLKIKKYYECAKKYKNIASGKSKVIFIIDISSVSSFPLWNTRMRRTMNSIIESIEELPLERLNAKILHEIIKNIKIAEYNFSEKYDVDMIITIAKSIASECKIETYYIDTLKTSESKHLVNEFKHFFHALSLQTEKRYDYIYDTVCDNMDNMFSIYGFCNFKNNMCVAQRHKNIFSRYPVPKTDGCCFKLVRKCEYNNRDGTCQVKCLPCKLFTCPHLGKISIGIRTSEIILMRAFFNNRQKKIALYKFFNKKETLMNGILRQTD